MKRWFSTMALAAVFSTAAFAHGTKPHADRKIDYSNVEEHVFGRAADPKRAKRTIRIDMTDAMRFHPAEITVKRGEVVRFVVSNKGKLLHELVLGTKEELEKHAELMRKFPDMEHDEPHMAHVDPGKTGQIGWQFTQVGEFYYGCLLPGHFEAGMVGRIRVTP